MFHESFQKYKVWEYLSKFIECNVAITKLSNSVAPTLKKLFLSCFAFDKVHAFLFLVRDYCIDVSSLVFVFFVLTQSKSETDSIKEFLSMKEMEC